MTDRSVPNTINKALGNETMQNPLKLKNIALNST